MSELPRDKGSILCLDGLPKVFNGRQIGSVRNVQDNLDVVGSIPRPTVTPRVDPGVVAEDGDLTWRLVLQLPDEFLHVFASERLALQHMGEDEASLVADCSEHRHILELRESPRLFERAAYRSPLSVVASVWLEDGFVDLDDLPAHSLRLANFLLQILDHALLRDHAGSSAGALWRPQLQLFELPQLVQLGNVVHGHLRLLGLLERHGSSLQRHADIFEQGLSLDKLAELHGSRCGQRSLVRATTIVPFQLSDGLRSIFGGLQNSSDPIQRLLHQLGDVGLRQLGLYY